MTPEIPVMPIYVVIGAAFRTVYDQHPKPSYGRRKGLVNLKARELLLIVWELTVLQRPCSREQRLPGTMRAGAADGWADECLRIPVFPQLVIADSIGNFLQLSGDYSAWGKWLKFPDQWPGVSGKKILRFRRLLIRHVS